GSASTVFLLLLMHLPPISSPNPHAPQRLTWQVLSQTGDIIWSTTGEKPLWAWWPSLTPDICALVAGLDNWDIPTLTSEEARRHWPISRRPLGGSEYRLVEGYDPGCSYPRSRDNLKQTPFYVCPRDGRSRNKARKCGGIDHYYCAAWGCETTGNTYWHPTSSWDLITVQQNLTAAKCYNQGWCNPLNISFTEKGRLSREWIKGRTWGFRFYMSGRDKGFTFSIRLKIETLTTVQVGPNLVLSEQRSSPAHIRPPVFRAPTNKPVTTPLAPNPANTPKVLNTGQRLLNLIQGAFSALNASNPNLTESCWLCLVSSPPYYEGIAFSGTFNNTTSHDSCSWESNRKLTLTEVSGQGTCLGTVPADHKHLCNRIIESPQTTTNYYLIPPVGGWWACSTGLTPCVASSVFNTTKDYCVLIQLIPRVIYHEAGSFEAEFDLQPRRQKREPVSLTLAVLLGLGVAAGVGTGTAALVQTPQYIEELQAAVDEDLKAIAQSITKLEESLTSLSEVVLQNRRGLDLLFLKDGGLCASLKEECCFYIDHSGVIKDSMSKLRERLETRQRDREAHQGWFESWYNRSPWFTTLMSTLMGPLVILLLLLTFGPCILNRLVTFIRERVSAVQVLMLRQQYQSLRQGNNLGEEYVETEVP
uniref:Envelope protein n=1 Tax=Sciurus vulgaris TaxID=55149 RepID=A0A8D2B6A5_SCIVU